jgi:uncharacterized protein (UPF0147 family)
MMMIPGKDVSDYNEQCNLYNIWFSSFRRVGLHSGPVVAGVLRGDKSRFQLFGDTMNTASRLESTGVTGRVQLSQETADLLIAAGKEKWLTLREDKVTAKGKGELTTYFLTMRGSSDDTASTASSDSFNTDTENDGEGHDMFADVAAMEEKKNRVAEWTVEVMSRLLRDIVVGRKVRHADRDAPSKLARLEQKSLSQEEHTTVIDEVVKVIVLPDYSAAKKKYEDVDESTTLDERIVAELRSYVQTIAGQWLTVWSEELFLSLNMVVP